MPEVSDSDPPKPHADKPDDKVQDDVFGASGTSFEDINRSVRQATSSALQVAEKTVNDLFGRVTLTERADEKRGGSPQESGAANGEMAARPQRGQEPPVFPDTKATDRENQLLNAVATPEQIEGAKKEINEFGRDPKSAILEAAKNNKVIGLGELHGTPNGLRTLTESMMPLLQASGVTHMAVEVHKNHQELLDKLGQGDEKAVAELQRAYGGMNNDAVRMMQAAAKEGIKLVAVDNDASSLEEQRSVQEDGHSSSDADVVNNLQSRDNAMAENISKIVESDPKAKVLFVVGSAHLESSNNKEQKSAGQLLKERGKEKGYSVATFGSQLDLDRTEIFSGSALAASATKPTAVEASKTDILKNIPEFTKENPAFKSKPTLGSHDHMLLFPRDSALRTSEQLNGQNNKKLIPDLESLANMQLSAGRKEDAVGLLGRALNIEKTHFGENSDQVAARHSQLARYTEGREVLGHLEQSLSIREKQAQGKSSPELLQATQALASRHVKEGNADEALKVGRKGSEFASRDGLSEGDARSWKESISGLSDSLAKAGKLEQAAALLSNDMELRKDVYKASGMSASQGKLASYYEELKQPEAAEKHRRAALDSAGNDGERFTAHAGLAGNMLAQNRPQEAEKHFKEAVSIMDKTGGPAAAEANAMLSQYAQLLKASGREEEAGAVLARMKKGRSSVSLDSVTRPESKEK